MFIIHNYTNRFAECSSEKRIAFPCLRKLSNYASNSNETYNSKRMKLCTNIKRALARIKSELKKIMQKAISFMPLRNAVYIVLFTVFYGILTERKYIALDRC